MVARYAASISTRGGAVSRFIAEDQNQTIERNPVNRYVLTL